MNAYKQNQPIERMGPCFVWKGQTAGFSLAGGIGQGEGWFRRHLIDPRPLLRRHHLIA
ncbi:MAG: hypothetical protein U5L07_09525 [Desulfobacterales bacterium]|nr:hypothetical protein [Desulfobacterales bacterium]